MPAKKKTSKKKAARAVTKPNPDAVAGTIDYSQFGVTGYEHTRTEDLGLPMLAIVQSKSPEFDETHQDHASKAIPGCKPGDIIDTITRQVIQSRGGPPVEVTISTHRKAWVEWKPRNKGGGFVQVHNDPNVAAKAVQQEIDGKRADVLPNGNWLVATSYFFGSYIGEDGQTTKVIIPMSSTQLKKARQWMSMAMSRKTKMGGKPVSVPLFGACYYLSTVPESNDQGSWYGYKVEPGELITDRDRLNEAVDWAKQAIDSQDRLLIGAQTSAGETDASATPAGDNVL